MEQMPKHICEKRTYTVEEISTLLLSLIHI